MAYVEASVRRPQLVAPRVARRPATASRRSLRTVAAEAGVSLGTLQHVFGSKESLLEAMIEDVVEEIATVLESAAELDSGLAHAIHLGPSSFWSQLVVDRNLQVVQ